MILSGTNLPAWAPVWGASRKPRKQAADAFEPSRPAPVDLRKAMQLVQQCSSPEDLRVRWTRDFGPRFYVAPNVGPDGSVAVVNDDALFVLRSDSGTAFSVAKVENSIWPESYNPPVFSRSGEVIVPSHYGLLAYAPNGRMLWNQPIGKPGGPPAVDDQGNVYVGTKEGTLHAFDRAGKPLWNLDLLPLAKKRWQREWEERCRNLKAEIGTETDPDRKERLKDCLIGARNTVAEIKADKTGWKIDINGGPYLTREGNLIVSEHGHVHCLDSKGQPVWHEELKLEGGRMTQLPDGRLAFCNWSSCLQVVDPATGKTEWEYGAWLEKRLDQVSPEEADEARRSGNVGANTCPAFSPDGKAIYFAGSDGKVRALTSEGQKLWSVELEAPPERKNLGNYLSVDVGRDGTVYVASSYGLHAYSPEGVQLWRYEVKGDGEVKVRVQGDSIFLNTYAGKVHCLRADDVKRVAELNLESEGTSRIAIADGFVIVGGVRVKRRTPPPIGEQ